MDNKLKNIDLSSYYNKSEIDNKIPFRLGKDSSGNYGYYKDGADTVTPFKIGDYTKEQYDAHYTEGYSAGKAAGAPKYTAGTKIGDWIVCANSDTMILFPLKDQTTGNWKTVYEYCSNFKTSPLIDWTVTSSRMPNKTDWNNIISQTGLPAKELAGSAFWLSSPDISTYDHDVVYDNGGIWRDGYSDDNYSYGARPIIVLKKL